MSSIIHFEQQLYADADQDDAAGDLRRFRADAGDAARGHGAAEGDEERCAADNGAREYNAGARGREREAHADGERVDARCHGEREQPLVGDHCKAR